MTLNAATAFDTSPLPTEFRRLAGSDLAEAGPSVDRHETAKLMLEAHENLCRTDDRNETAFKDVKHFLNEQIARDSKKPNS